MFSCEFCEIFKDAFFEEHSRTIASIDTTKHSKLRVLRNFIGSLEIIRNTWQSHGNHGIFIEAFVDTSLCEKCPYSELFWSAFSRIPTEYREVLSISTYSVQMWENTVQNNSEYGQLLRIVFYCCKAFQLTCLQGPWLRQYYSRVFFGLTKTQICGNIFIGFHYLFVVFDFSHFMFFYTPG